MLKQYRYAKALKRLTKKHKKDYLSSVLDANFEGQKHNMLIEEEIYIREAQNMPYPNMQEFSLLEKVDLIDFRKCYGRNKKRRSLLCRP